MVLAHSICASHAVMLAAVDAQCLYSLIFLGFQKGDTLIEHYISIHKTGSKLPFQRLYNMPGQAYNFATLNNIFLWKTSPMYGQ